MAKRLTEEMVIARTKISDLSKIKRLNCWGSELADVSLLRKMPCVEVLSLSINKIHSLIDFQFCKRLEELYIRQNNIRDVNEVVYLQNLPNLKNLWLDENPCANLEGYRLAIIKALPQLQKLDNIQILPEELRTAQRTGRNLIHPESQESEEEEQQQHYQQAPPSQQPQQYNRYQEYSESEYGSVQRSPPRQEPEFEEESEDLYPKEEVSEESKEYSPPRQASPPRRVADTQSRKSFSPDEPAYVVRRRNSYDRESNKHYYERCPVADSLFEDNITTTCDNNYREARIVNSQSASCIKEYTNGDRYAPSHPQYRESNDLSASDRNIHEKRERHPCPVAHNRPPFARRPVARNSNILSAVLRLVKELDYPSLEVLEMEVRSRMDELDE